MMTSDISNSLDTVEGKFREIVDCPFCGSGRYSPFTEPAVSEYGKGLAEPFASMKFQMVTCQDCRVVYQRNRPKPEHLGKYYTTGNYHCYESLLERGAIIKAGAIMSAKKVVKDIESLRSKRTDLFVDFGCGSGSWIELFKHVGAPWTIVGTEIFPELCAVVEKTGNKCVVADHDTIDAAFEPNSVDVLFMHHVIEHVPSPLEFFRKASKILTEGGIIYGQTPNWRCLEQSIFRTNWVQWHLPHHLAVFEPKTLQAHAEKAGLELVKVSSSLSSSTQWAASILNWIAKKRGREYRVTREPLHAPLTAAFLPITAVQILVSQASHIDFVLRKPAGSPTNL
jgi:SAM-dependent methyltransferase